MTLRAPIACLFAVALVAAAGQSLAQPAGEIPDELEGVGIEEHLGEQVERDIPFTDETGAPVSLGDYFDGERPVVVAFVYHNCPMLCSLVLDGMTEAVRATTLDLGDDYQVLAVSFDPRDTPERAADVEARYAKLVGDVAASGLHFLTGAPSSIERATGDLGFHFKWNERQQEFAHNAALFFLSPNGTITRVLYGIEFPPADFRAALLEAGEGTIGSPVDQLLLYCFVYDPDAGGYVLSAQRAMKVGGLLTVLLLGGFLFFFWRRESKKRPEPAAMTGP